MKAILSISRSREIPINITIEKMKKTSVIPIKSEPSEYSTKSATSIASTIFRLGH